MYDVSRDRGGGGGGGAIRNVGSSRKPTLQNALLMAHRERSLKRSQRRENHGGNRENDGLRFHTALAFYHLGHC